MKAFNVLKQLKTVTTERSILGVWQDSEHTFSFVKLYILKAESSRSRSVA